MRIDCLLIFKPPLDQRPGNVSGLLHRTKVCSRPFVVSGLRLRRLTKEFEIRTNFEDIKYTFLELNIDKHNKQKKVQKNFAFKGGKSGFWSSFGWEVANKQRDAEIAAPVIFLWRSRQHCFCW